MHVRRPYPDVLDPKLNVHSKLNDIMACIQATTAGADEALMLDPHGFVATCNSTHFFIVRAGEVWTSSGAYCLGGITRGTVLRVAREAGIPALEKQFSLTDVYGADEAFVTGTFAGLVPVREVDGRRIGSPGGDRPVIAPAPRALRRRGRRGRRRVCRCRRRGSPWSPLTVAEVVRLAVWSGPRNISTALMRAWENRPDTIVVDEPLYAHYLAATGIDHPGAAEVIEAGETDWRRVVASLLAPPPAGTTVTYQKHMAHHLLPEIDHAWIGELTNVLLIRDPREVVASYTKTRATVTPDDIGLPQQVRLYDELL